MVEDSVFPEDTGTGAPYGDFDDAANWASHAYNEDYGNYVITGIIFNQTMRTTFSKRQPGKPVYRMNRQLLREQKWSDHSA
jgi:hypothetical protein